MNSEFLPDREPKNEENEYVPGTCNMGEKEIERRKKLVIIGSTFTILSIVILQVFGFPTEWRLIIFFPLSFTILCFQEALQKFCVVFGIKGVFNFKNIRKVIRIEQEDDRKKDRKKGWVIIFTSALIGFVVAMIYFYLPF